MRDDAEHDDILPVQPLIVTAGPLAGRICENDDDDFVLRSDLRPWELKWFEECGVTWRVLDLDDDESTEDRADKDYVGVDCEIVTFGFYLHSRGHYYIPRQFLRPVTMKDLIQRIQEINEVVLQTNFIPSKKRGAVKILNDILTEKVYIMDTIWDLERIAKRTEGGKNVFLCHSSTDKPFVRQVFLDLIKLGHRVWIDEYEINVGDSIVEKINAATEDAGALVLFISSTSCDSQWVKREWSSALMRQLVS
jgi:TIR domain